MHRGGRLFVVLAVVLGACGGGGPQTTEVEPEVVAPPPPGELPVATPAPTEEGPETPVTQAAPDAGLPSDVDAGTPAGPDAGTPEPPSVPPPASAALLIGAGDIADCGAAAAATANLIDQFLVQNPTAQVFTAGDNAYNAGTADQFKSCFTPTWGKFKNAIHPAVGNHEYVTAGALPYFDYFGSAAGERGKGWYSFDVGEWHVVVLNSNCNAVGGCQKGSAQEQWLRADLAANPKKCTAAIWHHPLFSSGWHGGLPSVKDLWTALQDAGAEVVITGHEHDYERFAPMTAEGARDDAKGLREFVIGTGGVAPRDLAATQPNSEARASGPHGVMQFSLFPDHYEWKFLPIPGDSFQDSGSGTCH